MESEVVFVAESADDYSALRSLADEHNLSMSIDDELQPQLVDGVTPVLIAGAVVGAVKLVTDWIDKRRGGTIIDRTYTPTRISRSSGVPWGMVAVIASDGKVEVQVKDAPKDAMERWVGALFELPTNVTKAAIDGLKDLLDRDDEPKT